MNRNEREAAIVAEAQIRANHSETAQRVYWAYSSFGIKPADQPYSGEEVAVIQPQPGQNPFNPPAVVVTAEQIAEAQAFYVANPEMASGLMAQLDAPETEAPTVNTETAYGRTVQHDFNLKLF